MNKENDEEIERFLDNLNFCWEHVPHLTEVQLKMVARKMLDKGMSRWSVSLFLKKTEEWVEGVMEEYASYEEMIEKEIAKGEERKAKEIAEVMLEKGMAPDLISEVLNKPMEWVNNLQH